MQRVSFILRPGFNPPQPGFPWATRPARTALLAAWAMALLLAPFWSAPAMAQGSPGVNVAGIIRYPTGFDQFHDHNFHTTLSVVDWGKPDIRPANLRYGYQWGAAQIGAEVYGHTEPERRLDYAQLRVKLRVLTLDEIMSSFAIGALARSTDTPEGWDSLGGRSASLLAVATSEVIPFAGWGGLLVNLYWDNMVVSPGLRFQIYGYIHLVAEGDIYYPKEVLREDSYTAGFEIDNGETFYTQLLYQSQSKRALFQVGFGF